MSGFRCRPPAATNLTKFLKRPLEVIGLQTGYPLRRNLPENRDLISGSGSRQAPTVVPNDPLSGQSTRSNSEGLVGRFCGEEIANSDLHFVVVEDRSDPQRAAGGFDETDQGREMEVSSPFEA